MLFQGDKHKVPPAYSRADKCARSLNVRRDDEYSYLDITVAKVRFRGIPKIERGLKLI